MSRHWSILSNWMVNAVTLAFAAPLIFGVWYPYPTLHVLEMGRTLCTILGIQFLLAVALPILLIKTNKTKKALAIDWTLIIAIQIAAFLLGFFVLINGRPVAIVFERDRFVVLQANEVVWRSSKGNDHCAIQGSLRGPLLVAVDLQNPKLSPTELIFQSLQGIEPSQREELWTDYASASKQALDAAKPATGLRPEDFEKFFLKKINNPLTAGMLADQIKFIPFTSTKNKEWIVFLDNSGHAREYAPIDGFKQYNQ